MFGVSTSKQICKLSFYIFSAPEGMVATEDYIYEDDYYDYELSTPSL